MKLLLTLMLGFMSLQGYAAGRPFKVVSYNINFFMQPETVVQDLKTTPGLVDADIILLQEITRELSLGWDPLTVVAEKLGMHAVFIPSARLRGQEYGNGILSQKPLSRIEMVELPRSQAESKTNIRSAVIADLTLDSGEILTLASTHLSVFFCEKSTKDQPRADQLEVLLKRLRDRGSKNIIFGGDLNTSTPKGWNQVSKISKEYGYELSHEKKGWTMKILHLKLDHLYHQGNLQVINQGIGRGSNGSDHLPIWVDYQFSDKYLMSQPENF